MDVCLFYTPALRLDSLLKKRHEIKSDTVVVDLEDSIHVHSKQAARQKVAEFDFEPLAAMGVKLAVRINTIACFDGLADLELLKSLYEKGRFYLQTILLPKVSHPNEVKIYRALLGTTPFRPKLYTFIETVEAVDNADGIASVSDGLCFGQADLVSEMYSPNETFIDYARARMCIAAAKYNLPSVDTNSFEIKDMNLFRKQCLLAKSYGFTAKAAIHPDHVPCINDVFSVSPEAADKYRASIDTYYASGEGFVIRDGEVIAPPFIAKAKKMLRFYEKS